MAANRQPIYSGYIGWPDGLSVWPSKRRTRRWGDLEWIHTTFLPDHRTVVTTFRFRSGKKLTLRAARDFSWTKSRGRFAEIVALAVAAAPKEAKINEDTIELALWGSRASRRAAVRPAALKPDAEALVRRARHHRVWMELPKALSLVKEALRQQPTHADALRMRCKLYWELGRPREARRAAQEWLAVTPADQEAKSNLLQIELALDNPGAVEDARAMLARVSDNPALAAALAGFLFRRGEYEESATVWDKIAAGTPEPEVRNIAAEQARYVRRYGSDARFRRREKAKGWRRTALFVVVALVPLVLFVGLQVWRWHEGREWNKRIEEIRKGIDQDMEQWDRKFEDMTGRVLGTPEQIRSRADGGEAAAQLTYGEMLLKGDKVDMDVAAGLALIENAAAQDHSAAIVALAEHYRNGAIVGKDMERVVGLLKRASDLGSMRASVDLAQMYFNGEGTEMDKAAAFALFERGAEGDNTFAMRRAGMLLERGEGVEQDTGRALQYYRRAAEKNDRWSVERLARLLSRQGSEHYNREEAWNWVRKGAELGSGEMRVMFAGGVLSAGMSTDEKASSALPWLIEAADGGHSAAQGFLGSCYFNGWGVPQDFARGAELLARAEPEMQQYRAMLARCHAFGLGVPRDIEKAKELRSRVEGPEEQKWLDRYLAGASTVAAPARSLVPVFQDQPLYPIQLSRLGVEGRVVLGFTVNREGFVGDVRVIESTQTEFEAPARLAISCWKFAPLDGRESVNVQLPMSFNLNERTTEEVETDTEP